MDTFDKKIRSFLIDEGYLFPQTDAEIQAAIAFLQENPVTIPPEIDNPNRFLQHKKTRPTEVKRANP